MKPQEWRRSRAGVVAQDQLRSFDDENKARVTVVGGAAIRYARGYERAAVVANDDAPNTTAPPTAHVIPGERPTLAIGVFGVVTAEVGLAVWARSDATGTPWVRLAEITLAADDSYAEHVVNVGARDAWVQIVSGATGGTPVDLYVGAA